MDNYKTSAEPRAMIGDIPVFCAYDELVDIGKVIPNPKNPNQHPKAQIELLAKIIKAQGWRQAITVSTRSGLIVKGHGRLEAAIILGTDKVPVDFQNYATEAEEIADLTADNRLAELAEMNNTMLADILAEFDTGEMPLDLTGYTEADLEGILDAIAGEDDAEPNNQDDEHEQPLSPMSKPGDLWILGQHRLLCGDATDEATIERLMDGEKGAMVHTDPPYGVSYLGGPNSDKSKWGMIKNDDKTHDELFNELLLPAFNLYRKHTIENSSQPGEIVLDFFGGSGSTLLGAEMTGRRCFTTELDPVYCDVIISRYVTQTGNIGVTCVRDGKEISYIELVREWAKANGKEKEVNAMKTPVVVIKKIVQTACEPQNEAVGGDNE